jgi:hypothetical protein
VHHQALDRFERDHLQRLIKLPGAQNVTMPPIINALSLGVALAMAYVWCSDDPLDGMTSACEALAEAIQRCEVANVNIPAENIQEAAAWCSLFECARYRFKMPESGFRSVLFLALRDAVKATPSVVCYRQDPNPSVGATLLTLPSPESIGTPQQSLDDTSTPFVLRVNKNFWLATLVRHWESLGAHLDLSFLRAFLRAVAPPGLGPSLRDVGGFDSVSSPDLIARAVRQIPPPPSHWIDLRPSQSSDGLPATNPPFPDVDTILDEVNSYIDTLLNERSLLSYDQRLVALSDILERFHLRETNRRVSTTYGDNISLEQQQDKKLLDEYDRLYRELTHRIAAFLLRHQQKPLLY